MTSTQQLLENHVTNLRACSLCPAMVGPVVTHGPVLSRVMLIGQAPGPKEGEFGKPFAWTAGKTLFKWFNSIGVPEEAFRRQVYMAAVCRCFPGKTKHGGDRVPSRKEVANCSSWLQREFELLQPSLVIPVGKLAIDQLLTYKNLTEVVGKQLHLEIEGCTRDIVPLPHPSGASTWFKREPGITLLGQALDHLRKNRHWQEAFSGL